MSTSSLDDYKSLEQSRVLLPLGQMHYIGPKTKALQLKLAFNFLVVGLTSVFANSLAMVHRAGLNTEKFLEILRPSAFYFKYIDYKVDRMLKHQYDDPNFTTLGALKDVKAIEQEMQALGVGDAIAKALIETLTLNVEQKGNGGADFSSVFEALVKDTNKDTQQQQ